jgi:hypothetical protein
MRYIWTRVAVAFWVAFMIATVGPALFGDLLLVTAPVTCPAGRMEVRTDVYNPHPGETVMNRVPLCVAADGSVSEVPNLLALIIIFAYALLPAVVIMWFVPSSVFSYVASKSNAASGRRVTVTGGEGENLARLNELKQAHDAGLITKAEYDQKRKDILKGM